MDIDALRKKMQAKKAATGRNNEPMVWLLAIDSQEEIICKFNIAKSLVENLTIQLNNEIDAAIVEQFNEESSLDAYLSKNINHILGGGSYELSPWQEHIIYNYPCQITKAERTTDTTRSDNLYKYTLDNLDNLLPTTNTMYFETRMEGIHKVAKSNDISAYESDRLLLLQSLVSLLYFKEHISDDDYCNYESEYLKILDSIDDTIKEMNSISNEAGFLYFVANMYSIKRYKDISPEDKLTELWDNIKEIELDDNSTEFKVEFWHDLATEIHDFMSDTLKQPEPDDDIEDDDIDDCIIALIADKLGINKTQITKKSNLVTDLGADSLDAVDLIMEMEKEFGISIPDEDVEDIHTVGDAILYVKGNL
jgi:acyl carrier protein